MITPNVQLSELYHSFVSVAFIKKENHKNYHRRPKLISFFILNMFYRGLILGSKRSSHQFGNVRVNTKCGREKDIEIKNTT